MPHFVKSDVTFDHYIYLSSFERLFSLVMFTQPLSSRRLDTNASILGPGFTNYCLVLTPYLPEQIFPLFGETLVDTHNIIYILEVKSHTVNIFTFAIADKCHSQVPGVFLADPVVEP